MENKYFKKYLLYKKKYNDLKNQYGGLGNIDDKEKNYKIIFP